MPQLPRIAIGTTQPDTPGEALCWALLKSLCDRGLHVQHFLSRACFSPHDGARAASGNSSRHLDSWLMSPSACRATFLRGARDAEIAVIEGQFRTSHTAVSDGASLPDTCVGGSLEALCDWLDLPRLAIVDVSKLSGCLVPDRPAKLDAVLLDRFTDERHFRYWQANLEALWRVPVVGGLADLAALRRRIDDLPPGAAPGAELCGELARRLMQYTDLAAIQRLAAARAFPASCYASSPCAARPVRLRIAMAYDEAFNCYFPDTLDLLEMLGATVVDFSPLRDERLPDNVDVVYFGCGHPERCAEVLAANQCMLTSIRRHLCSGRRLYGEGGGLAYLCQYIETPTGASAPMLGVLPATARLAQHPHGPRPVELTLAHGNWLAEKGTTLRGYLNGNWQIKPSSPLRQYAAAPEHRLDLVGQYQAIGSRVHFNFAAQPEFLARFIQPHSTGSRSAPV